MKHKQILFKVFILLITTTGINFLNAKQIKIQKEDFSEESLAYLLEDGNNILFLNYKKPKYKTYKVFKNGKIFEGYEFKISKQSISVTRNRKQLEKEVALSEFKINTWNNGKKESCTLIKPCKNNDITLLAMENEIINSNYINKLNPEYQFNFIKNMDDLKLIYQIKNLSTELVNKLFEYDKNSFSYFKRTSNEMLKKVLEKNPEVLNTKKMTLTYQQELMIVERFGLEKALTILSKPSEEFSKHFFKESPYLIRYISKPSKENLLFFINKESNLSNIKKYLNSELLDYAIKKDLNNIKYIPNPSEEEQLKYIRNNGKLYSLKNPTEKVIFEALKISGYNYKNSSKFLNKEEHKIAALMSNSPNCNLIKRLKKPSYKLIKQIIAKNPHCFKRVKKRYSKKDLLFKEVLKINGKIIEYGKNKQQSTKNARIAIKTYPQAIAYIQNPSIPFILEQIKKDPKVITKVNNPSNEMAQLAFNKGYMKAIKFLNNPTKEEQFLAVEDDPINIAYIKNPTIEVFNYSWQKGYLLAIKFLDNPSEKTQLKVINKDPYLINEIKNPSDTIKMKAIENSKGSAINKIKKPTDEMILKSIKLSNGSTIVHIEKPSNKIRNLALELSKGKEIKSLNKPSKKEILKAIELGNSMAVYYLNNPGVSIIKKVLKDTKGKAIKVIKNPTENIQLLAVKENVKNITYIKYPTENVQFYVIKKDLKNIKYINNSSENVQLFVLKKNPRYKKYIYNISQKVLNIIMDYHNIYF